MTVEQLEEKFQRLREMRDLYSSREDLLEEADHHEAEMLRLRGLVAERWTPHSSA